jgi:hypothetical protein
MKRQPPVDTNPEEDLIKRQHEAATQTPDVLAAERKAERTSTSRGERLFDFLTYGGIGFLGVFAAGIPVGYWAKYGKGSSMFNSAAHSLEKWGMSSHAAQDVVMTSVLMQPGNLAVIPIKMMENNKQSLVKKFNDMLGDKSADASVEEDARQTWDSLVKSRATAWLAVFSGFRGFGMVVGNDKMAAFENGFATRVCNFLGKPTHIPGMAELAANETRLFRYGKIAALDLFATAAATTLLYMGTRFFARKNPRWHADHIAPQDDVQPAAAPAGAGPAIDSAAIHSPGPQQPKIFTDSITPRNLSARPKEREGSFAESLKSAAEPSLTLGA